MSCYTDITAFVPYAAVINDSKVASKLGGWTWQSGSQCNVTWIVSAQLWTSPLPPSPSCFHTKSPTYSKAASASLQRSNWIVFLVLIKSLYITLSTPPNCFCQKFVFGAVWPTFEPLQQSPKTALLTSSEITHGSRSNERLENKRYVTVLKRSWCMRPHSIGVRSHDVCRFW